MLGALPGDPGPLPALTGSHVQNMAKGWDLMHLLEHGSPVENSPAECKRTPGILACWPCQAGG